MISQIFMQTCDTLRRCKHLPVAVKVTAKKEFTLQANDQVSCRSLPKMLHTFNQRNAVFEVLIRKDLTIARNGCVYKNNTRQRKTAAKQIYPTFHAVDQEETTCESYAIIVFSHCLRFE